MHDKHVAPKRGRSRPRVRPYKAPPSSPRLTALNRKRFAERLGELARIDAKRLGYVTQQQFAEWIGLADVRTVQRWRQRKNTPQAEQLYAIAERTGVSVDWLLGFDVPKYRGQTRLNTTTIEADFALAVEHRLRAQFGELLDRASIDGAALLDFATEEVAREAANFADYEKRVVDIALSGALDLSAALDFWQIDIERAGELQRLLKKHDENAPKGIEERLLPLFLDADAIEELSDVSYDSAQRSWAKVLGLRELALGLLDMWARSDLTKHRFLKVRRLRSNRVEAGNLQAKLGLAALKRLSAQARGDLVRSFERIDEKVDSSLSLGHDQRG